MPAAAPQPSFVPPVPNRARLDNGLNILHVEKRGLPTVAFGLVIRSGAVNDPSDRAGLANLTTSMLTEGTASRSAQHIADEIEFLGSHLRASASREHIVIISDGLTSTWRDALEVVGDMAQNAAFPSSDLERVRANLLTDLRRVSDNPATISARATRGVMYGSGTPYGHPLTGAAASVELASADDLRAFFRAHLRSSNATLIIVGDLSLDQAMAAAQDTFGDWTGSATANGAQPAPTDNPATANGAQPDPTPTAIYLADKPGAAQSVIRTGHLTIPARRPPLHGAKRLQLHIRRTVRRPPQHEPAPGQKVTATDTCPA